MGSGNCVLRVSEVFNQDEDDGLAVVRENSPPEDLHDLVREAAEFCPTGAITVEGA